MRDTLNMKNETRQLLAIDITWGAAGLVLGLVGLAAVVAGLLAFMSDDLELAVVAALAFAAAEGGGWAAARVFGARRGRVIRRRAERYGRREWTLPGGVRGHLTDVSYLGERVRLCDEAGNNDWHPVSAVAGGGKVRRGQEELDAFIAGAKPALEKRVMLTLASFLAPLLLMIPLTAASSLPGAAGASATAVSGYVGFVWLATAYLGYRAVREALALEAALAERYEGAALSDPANAVGTCVGVSWMLPPTLSLKYANGDVRQHPLGHLAPIAA